MVKGGEGVHWGTLAAFWAIVSGGRGADSGARSRACWKGEFVPCGFERYGGHERGRGSWGVPIGHVWWWPFRAWSSDGQYRICAIGPQGASSWAIRYAGAIHLALVQGAVLDPLIPSSVCRCNARYGAPRIVRVHGSSKGAPCP